MPILSIIVPIYKVEKYLHYCIESILAQRFTDFELILVDDGSPDCCSEICDTYQKKDERVKVIHQTNQGSIQARWNGLLEAKGEYVSFVDGDDWVEDNMYEHMMDLALKNSADLIVVGYIEDSENVQIPRINNIVSGIYSGESLQSIYDKMLYFGKFYSAGIIPALWNKIIRREKLLKLKEKPNPLIRMGEDAVITYPIIAVSSCIVVDNEFKPYHYRVVQDSMSRAYDELYFERAVELFKNLKINLALNETMQKDLQYYALFIIEIGINQLLSRNCKLRFRKKIEKIRWMWQQMEMLGLFKETNWFGFKPGAKKRAEYFIEGHIMKLVLYTCCQKIICKLGGYR